MAGYSRPRNNYFFLAILVTGILLCELPGARSETIEERGMVTTPMMAQTTNMTNTDDMVMVFQKNSNSSFAIINQKMSWDEAFIWCLKRQGRLADVLTREEMNSFLKVTEPNTRYWVGGTNHGQEGKFIWAANYRTAVDLKLFARPSNSGTEKCMANCVALKTDKNDLGLTTRRCHENFLPICKFET